MQTILLVDDDQDIRELLQLLLGNVGYTVLTAGSGDEAIRICEQHPGEIHLLLTDIMLANNESGLVLVTSLVALQPKTKVIFMSAEPPDELIQKGSLNHEALFIQKPFDPDMLVDKIQQVLG